MLAPQATNEMQENPWPLYGAVAALPMVLIGLYLLLFGRDSGTRGRGRARDWSESSDSDEDSEDDSYDEY